MNQIILKKSSLESKGFQIYHTEINNNQCYAYYFQMDYDLEFKQSDMEQNSKYLRNIYLFKPHSKYVFFQNPSNQRIADLRNLSQHEILLILGQIATALYNLHQMKSMGRCFSIQNIIIMNQDQIQVKLMDFGFGSPLLFKPVESPDDPLYYDIRLDLFLLGRVVYFLCSGDDIKIQSNYKDQYKQICKNMISSDFSYELKDVVCKLLHPKPDDRCSFIKLFKFLYNQTKDLLYFEIQQFYLNLDHIQEEIQEKIQSRENKSLFIESLVPPQIDQPLYSLRDKIIFCFEPQNQPLYTYLNFYLYKIKLINLLLENILLNLNTNSKISVPLSIFVLRKMKCILFIEFEQILLSQQLENFTKEELWNFKKTQQWKQCLDIIQRQNATEKKQISSYFQILNQSLRESYDKYQTNQLYIQASSFLNENCNGLNFDRVKKEYRFPLNNLIDQIEKIKDQKILAKFRLLTMMCLLINKIMRVDLLDLHFQTIKNFHLIEKIDSPIQIDLFIHKADFEQHNNLYNELKAIHFNKN